MTQPTLARTFRVPCRVTYDGYALVEASSPEHAKEVAATDPACLFDASGQERIEVTGEPIEEQRV